MEFDVYRAIIDDLDEAAPQIAETPSEELDTPAYYDVGRKFGNTLRQLAEYYTGEENGVHSIEREIELFTAIQARKAAKERLTEIDKIYPTASTGEKHSLAAEKKRLDSVITQGDAAFNEIIEVNSRFARFMARASVGIEPRYRKQTKKSLGVTTDSAASAMLSKGRKGRVGTYANIADLAGPHAELEDREQNAVIGLMKAVEKYDPSKGVRFITYAAYDIQHTIEQLCDDDEIREYVGPRIPQHVEAEFKSLLKDYCVTSSEDEQFQYLPAEVRARLKSLELHIKRRSHINISNATPLEYSPQFDPDTLVPKTNDLSNALATTASPQDESEFVLLNELIEVSVLDNLSEREAGILAMRHGLNGTPLTLAEIARIYGVTEERIRQIESKAQSIVRRPLIKKALQGYEKYSAPYQETDMFVACSLGRIAAQKKEGLEPEPISATIEDLPRPIYNSEEYNKIADTFRRFMQNLPYDSFELDSNGFPIEIAMLINRTFGNRLTPEHLEDFWNNSAERFITLAGDLYPASEFKANELVPKIIFAALSTRMTDNDHIILEFNDESPISRDYVGAWQKKGTITINANNLGSRTGYMMGGNATLIINSNVDKELGAKTTGRARIVVSGNCNSISQAVGKQVIIDVQGSVLDNSQLTEKRETVEKEQGYGDTQSMRRFDLAQELQISYKYLDKLLKGLYGPMGKYKESFGSELVTKLRETNEVLSIPVYDPSKFISIEEFAAASNYNGSVYVLQKELSDLGFETILMRDHDCNIRWCIERNKAYF